MMEQKQQQFRRKRSSRDSIVSKVLSAPRYSSTASLRRTSNAIDDTRISCVTMMTTTTMIMMMMIAGILTFSFMVSTPVESFQHSPGYAIRHISPSSSSFTSSSASGSLQRQSIHNPRHEKTSTALPPSPSKFYRTPTLRSKTTTQLSAGPIASSGPVLLSVASSPIGAVTVLAGIVLIHEAGHYLAARSFNISVEEFSIGFGPRLVGFEALGNEFNLRALPLGGYVKFPPNFNTTLVEQQQDAAREAYRARVKSEEWTLSERIIDLASLGLWDQQRRKKAKKKQAEEQSNKIDSSSSTSILSNIFRRKSLSQKSTTPPTDPEDYEIEYFDDPTLLQNRPWPERAVVLSGGVIFNLLLSFSLYFGAIFGPANLSNQGLPRPVFEQGVVVSAPPVASGPASTALKQGDVITSINGRQILLPSSSSSSSTSAAAATTTTSVMEAQKQVSDVISTIRETADGDSVEFEVMRDSTVRKVTLKPQRATTSKATTTSTASKSQPSSSSSSSPQTIGVLLAPKLLKVEKLQTDNPVLAAKLAYEYLSTIFSQTLEGILSVLKTFVTPNSKPQPGQSISGPIGLIKQGSNVVATRDLTTVLLFAAGLSVNLGVINALPLPALDGGQLVFVISEAITGKKIDQRLQEGITSVAVLFLLWVSVSAAIGDVGNILSGLL